MYMNLNKEAGFLKELKEAIKFSVEGLSDYVIKPAAITLPLSAAALAVAYSRLKSPNVIAKNVDKRLLLNTLDTEIAVMEKQLEDIKNKENSTAKVYDRFV